MRLLCSALDASNSAGEQESSTEGDEPLLTSDDLDRRVFPNGIRCRMRSDASDEDDEDDEEEARVHLRRQADSLLSCTEAKCSRGNTGNYADCIYRNCIDPYGLGLKSLLLSSKRNARSSTTTDRLKASKSVNKERRSKFSEGSMDDDGEGSGHATSTTGSISSRSKGLEARLQVRRRGFNDIADVCVQHHCGSFNPHSMNFFSCVESHCAFR